MAAILGPWAQIWANSLDGDVKLKSPELGYALGVAWKFGANSLDTRR